MNLKALGQGARVMVNIRILPEDEPVKSPSAPFHIRQPHERPLRDRLMVKVPAPSIGLMIVFRVALCITENPANGTVSQCREGPARFGGCRITMRTPVGIIRKAAL